MVAKSVMSQLQSVGEGALGKLSQSPATRNAVQGAVQVKERGERIWRTLDSIDERLTAIERRLGTLEKHQKAEKRAKSAAKRGPAAPRPTSRRPEAGADDSADPR